MRPVKVNLVIVHIFVFVQFILHESFRMSDYNEKLKLTQLAVGEWVSLPNHFLWLSELGIVMKQVNMTSVVVR